MPTSESASLHRRARPPDPGTGVVHDIRPADAGWRYVGFPEHRLAAGAGLARPGDDSEVALIVMEGAVTCDHGAQRYSSLGSRADVVRGTAGSRSCCWRPAAPLEVAGRDGRDRHRRRRARRRRTHHRASSSPPTSSWRRAAADVTERRIHHLLPPSAPGRPAHPLRGLHARRQLVELPAPQARHRGPAARGLPRGALLLPLRAARRAGPSPASTRRTGPLDASFAPRRRGRRARAPRLPPRGRRPRATMPTT